MATTSNTQTETPKALLASEPAISEEEKRRRRNNNKIQVSSNKRPFTYVNLAKRLFQNFEEVELSGLGFAIITVVTVSEILRNQGEADIKKNFHFYC